MSPTSRTIPSTIAITIIAGEQLGRRVYGLELSPAFVDVIVARWEAYTGQKAILQRS